MGTGKFNADGNPAMDYHPIQGGVEILLVDSCYRNRDKLRPNGPLGSYADFYSRQTIFSISKLKKTAKIMLVTISKGWFFLSPRKNFGV